MEKIEQSKYHSMVEVILNTASGFIISFTVTTFLLPYMQQLGAFNITCLFTVVSLVRSYAWRRYFTKRS